MAKPGRCTLAALALLGCVAAVLTATSAARAQVNTERLRVSSPDSGLSGSVSASAMLKRGNAELLQLDGKSFALYYTEPHAFLLSGSAAFGEEGGNRFAAAAFAHARWTAMWLPRTGSELFVQAQYDAFLRLKLRRLVGAGPRFLVVTTESVLVAFGTGYMLEHERLDIPASDPHPGSTLAHRSTNYVALTIELRDRLRFGNTLYAQPRLDRPSDLRVLDELELRFDLDEHVALTTSFSARFDSDPPSQVEELDVALKNGVELTL
jgi:putative salt-induced outer membrane protein YdiY